MKHHEAGTCSKDFTASHQKTTQVKHHHCDKGAKEFATNGDIRKHMDLKQGNNFNRKISKLKSNYLSAEDDLECKFCERNCGKGFYTTHRLDHTAKSAAQSKAGIQTGSSEEKLEKHKDYKFNQKLKNVAQRT